MECMAHFKSNITMVTIYDNTMLNCQDMQNPHVKENSLTIKNARAPVDHMFTGKTYFKNMVTGKFTSCVGYIITPRGKNTRVFVDEHKPAKVGYKKNVWVRDLTRECVESNPGPSKRQSPLCIIKEEEILMDYGIYEICHACGNCIYLMDYDKTLVFYRNNCKFCVFEVQSLDLLDDYQQRFKSWLWNGEHLGKSFLGRHLNITGQYDKEINLVEDISILMFHFIRSRSNTDRCVAVVNFCKLRGLKFTILHTLLDIVDDLFYCAKMPSVDEISARMGFVAQDEDNIELGFERMREVLGTYDKLKEMAVYKKLHKFFMYMLCTGMLSWTKINFKSLQFDKFEEEALKRTHKPGFDMVHAMLDAVVFVCEAGYSYFKTGNTDRFFHSGSSYEKWLTVAQKLKMQSKFLSNPEPHGINRFSFVSELKDAIEKGKAIVKYTGGLDRSEKLYLQKILMELQLIEAEETTKRSAQQPRKDPFGILIHGSSHIAKSKLTEIMFKHYGKCFNLPVDDSYRYTRCPTDEYWSGFDSTQWCIVMDDIAFLAPTGEVDPTLKELLQVKNSVPYTPPQASLEDKGRTPVKAELLIATTNTKHLNLHAYFACPFAIARRLSYVVTPTVKKEYVKQGFMVDSKKIPPTPDGEYMNIWNFTVSIPVPESEVEKDNQRTKYKEIEMFEDINSFLQWYIFVAEEHAESQRKADSAAKSMADVKVCLGCKRPVNDCLCGTNWPHKYNKCNVCEKFLGNCICDEQVEISDFDDHFKVKLGIYAKVVQNDLIVMDQLHTMLVNWKFFYLPLVISSLFLYPCIFIVFYLLCILCYYFIKYLPRLLYHYYAWTLGSMWKYKLLFKFCGNSIDTWKLIFRLAGEKVRKIEIQKNYLYKLGTILAVPAVLLSLRALWRMFIAEKDFKEKVVNAPKTKEEAVAQGFLVYEGNKETVSGKECKKYEAQGNEGSIPVPMDKEKPTFYWHDPYTLTSCEISGTSKCAQGSILEDRLKNQTAKFNMRFPTIGRGSWTTGVNIFGNLWLLNKHAIKCDVGELDIIRDDTKFNVSRNVYKITFDKTDIREIPDTDMVILQLRSIAPGKSLLDYFPLDNVLQGVYKGEYIMKNKSGIISKIAINNIRPGSCPIFGVPGYHGVAVRPTESGDCGSMCLCDTGSSQIIIGMHTSGAPNGGVAMQHISQKAIRACIDLYEAQVSEGTIPISADGCMRELTDLHTKSCIRFLESGTANVYGSFKGYRPKHKSKVVPTYISEYVVENGYSPDFGPPAMNWQPWHLAIKDMTTPVHCYLNNNIKKCEDAFFNDIISNLGDKLSMLEVYSIDVALNGADGVTYVDKINCSTSAGNPFKTSKKNFITQVNGKITSVDQVILDRVVEIEKCYDNNTRFHPQFCGHLKDEPVTLKKIAAGKTRVFTGGEFAWSIVVRKYLLSHIRLIQNNPFVFEAMPGVVAQSTEWRDLYHHITHFGKDRIIAGDYGKFDKRMAAPFILSAFRILERLAIKAGWPDKDVRYIRCIAYDTAFPCIDFNGDLIEIQGNPSGHPLTVIINCLVNSLYMRYAYMLISGKSVETFQKYVHLATYGDDNIMGVSLECPMFNHTRIAAAMKCIGVEYTMAEKEAESVPYIHIDESSFLKRSFRYDPDIGCIVAPLDKSSFNKMLTSRVFEPNMAPEAHDICVIETALREYFFYGKDVFMDRYQFFQKLVDDCELRCWVKDSTFPDYYDLVYNFWMKYNDYENACKYSLREHTLQSLVVDAIPLVCGEKTLNRVEALSAENTYEQIGQTFLGRGFRVKSTCCTLVQEQVSEPEPVVLDSSSSGEEMNYNSYELLGYHLWQSQSEIIIDETKHDTNTKVEGLVSFMEHQEISTVGPPAYHSLSNYTDNTALAKFLARPVRVQTFTWNESDTVGSKVNYSLWGDWLQTSTVLNKVNNYSFFSGDLKVKVQLSASPFYYGMMIMSYRPLTGFKGDTYYADPNNDWLSIVTQRSHIKIDPDNGDTYEFTQPFLNEYNQVNIQNLSIFQGLGNTRFDVLTPLRSANGVSTAGVTVNVYCWVENVVLSGASAGYAAQSDEYGEGCVSKPASWVANIAGRLSDMPIIGPFATATKIGANAVSAIASMFGFTNVPVIDDTIPQHPESFPKLATAEIGFPVEKLTLDPKNELSIDPRIFGLPDGTDELSLIYISGRECWLATSTWSTADTVDTIKFSCLVHPMLSRSNTMTGATYIHPTPLSFTAGAFRQWRGDIILTLRVIASKYHKGKLKISFDPTGNTAPGFNILTNANTSNIVQTAILDIGENREVEFTIPYEQALQFLDTTGNYSDWSTSSSPSLTTNRLSDNGTFTVRVQNLLTAPVATSSVDIQVWIRGGPNMEFANPDDIDFTHRGSYFAPQSEDYISIPINGKVTLGAVTQRTDNQYLVHFGEDIKSFRQLLHRYNKLMTDYATPSVVANTFQQVVKMVPRLPMTPGYSNLGYHTANKQGVGTTTYNFCEFTLLAYLANAYIGYRGSVNYTFNCGSNIPSKNVYIARYPGTTASFTSNSTVVTSLSQLARAACTSAGCQGAAVTNQLTQSGINVTCPMYVKEKFLPTDPFKGNTSSTVDKDYLRLQVDLPFPTTTMTDNVTVTTYVAAGADFSLHYFLNAPTLYVYNTYPAAV